MTTHPDEADTADRETSSNHERELRTEPASPTSRRSILAALAAAGLASVVGTGTASAQADLDKDGILSGRRNEVLGRFPVVAGGLANQALDNFAVVGGGRNNRAGSDGSDPNSAPYATVSGGLRNLAYRWAVVGGGRENKATGQNSTVGGGENNTATEEFAFVGGGSGNTASGVAATVGCGRGNTASGNGATVSGGDDQLASANAATISGGFGNEASNVETTVGGGDTNTASGRAATVSGGRRNTASAESATVSGGLDNTASGQNASVGGGANTTASAFAATATGHFSTATSGWATVSGGFRGDASGETATVGGGQYNTASGQAATVGGGGYNTASGESSTIPGGWGNISSGRLSFAAGQNARTESSDGTPHEGAVVFADATERECHSERPNEFRSQMPMFAPSFNTTSARAKKQAIDSVDPSDVLDAVVNLEVSTWEFTDTDDGRHMGPMAGEFHDAFGLGGDETTIASVDADGVSLAAIQGLADRLNEKNGRIDELETENEALREQYMALEARLVALEEAEHSPECD